MLQNCWFAPAAGMIPVLKKSDLHHFSAWIIRMICPLSAGRLNRFNASFPLQRPEQPLFRVVICTLDKNIPLDENKRGCKLPAEPPLKKKMQAGRVYDLRHLFKNA
jgi:hypothetical protein